MKNIFLVAVLMFSASAFASNVNVYVKGMVCAFCAQGIEKKFNAEKSIQSVKVDLDAHLVALEYKDGQSMDDKNITSILEEAGYTVEKIERK